MICSQPPPLKKLIPPKQVIPPKTAIGPNPPLTEDFQKSPIPPKSWGDSHYGFVKTVNDFQQLTNFERRSILDVQQGSEYTSVSDLHICKYPIILAYLHLFTALFRVQCYQNFLSFSYFADLQVSEITAKYEKREKIVVGNMRQPVYR